MIRRTLVDPRRPEIRIKLNGFGITTDAFEEFVANTRFNVRYILSISDILGRIDTYRVEKVYFKGMTISGEETQVIKTRWTETTVQPTSSDTSAQAQFGASYIFGFQLYKGFDVDAAFDQASSTMREILEGYSPSVDR